MTNGKHVWFAEGISIEELSERLCGHYSKEVKENDQNIMNIFHF